MSLHPWLPARAALSRRGLALAGATMALAAAPGAAEAAVSTPAESFALSPTNAGAVFSESTAAGGKALRIWSNGAATRSVTQTDASQRLVVRARGEQCSGAPQMAVDVDGKRVLSSAVSSTTYRDYAVDVPVAAGAHSVKVAFLNDFRSTCDRNLIVDTVSLQAAAAAAPAPAPATGGPAWWLVDEAAQVVAGPFPDRIDADWAAVDSGSAMGTRAVYGEQRADGGGLVRRQLPQERAWLSELGDQLDRLAEDWDALLTDEDALTSLVVEVAAALVEAGLVLHDCTGGGPAGGVCLTPEAGHRGIVVSWHRHDRMSLLQVRGAAADAAVQRTMNAALTELLVDLGFVVESFGETGCCLVTAVAWEA
jgi:hypothetical protein